MDEFDREYLLANEIDCELDTRDYADERDSLHRENREGFAVFTEEWQDYMGEWEDNF